MLQTLESKDTYSNQNTIDEDVLEYSELHMNQSKFKNAYYEKSIISKTENENINVKDIIHINTSKKQLYRLKFTNSKEKLKTQAGLSNKSLVKEFETEDIISIRQIKVNFILK